VRGEGLVARAERQQPVEKARRKVPDGYVFHDHLRSSTGGGADSVATVAQNSMSPAAASSTKLPSRVRLWRATDGGSCCGCVDSATDASKRKCQPAALAAGRLRLRQGRILP
jgi:hypothetical protein